MITKINGLNKLLDQMEKMGNSLQGEDVQPILLEAAAPIVAAMKGRVRRKTGRLANSIKVLPFNPKYPYSVIIGPDFKENGTGGQKGTMTIAALASIQEFGAKARIPKKTSKRGGDYRRVLINGEWRTMSISTPFKAIPAHPFIRPVFDMTKESSGEAIKKGLIEIINQKAIKLNLK